MITAITVLLILIALSAIGVIVVRKLPQLSSLHIKQTPQEKIKHLKQHIVVSRMIRKMHELQKKIIAPENWQRMLYVVKDAYSKLKVLEDKYKVHTSEGKVKLLLKRGTDNLVDDPEISEQCFLDVITLDAHNLQAYEGLSRIYLAKESFHEAGEILAFLVKLNPASAGRYLFDLAAALKESGDLKMAWQYAVQAVTFEPANPKYLDFSVVLAILGGHRKEGEQYLKRLNEVNPDNAKVVEFQEKLKALTHEA